MAAEAELLTWLAPSSNEPKRDTGSDRDDAESWGSTLTGAVVGRAGLSERRCITTVAVLPTSFLMMRSSTYLGSTSQTSGGGQEIQGQRTSQEGRE